MEKALKELRTKAPEKVEDASKVFLTENDILAARILYFVVAPTAKGCVQVSRLLLAIFGIQ